MKAPLPFTVMYEDRNIIAVNKASGISVGGDRWDESRERLDKLVGSAMHQPKQKLADEQKLYTVHRIDRETSGLVLFAKDEETHRRLSLAFEGRDVKKRYIAIVHGRPSWQETACDLPLVPNGNKQHLTIIDKFQGKKSLTTFRFICSAGNYSILEAIPETGRTHQIRVHATALGLPVVCDSLYGSESPVMLSSIKKNWHGDLLEEKPLLARLGLHSVELSLPVAVLPYEFAVGLSIDKDFLTFVAPFPRDMAALIKQMKKVSFSVICT